MHNGQTISLKKILWNILNHPLANDLTYDIAAEFAIEGLRLIGAPLLYEDKVTEPHLLVDNHKCLLPSNLIKIHGIRLIEDIDNPEKTAIPLRYATDIYHKSKIKNTLDELTYTIQNGVLYTSFPKGCVEIAYECISSDKDGFPLIPDNIKVKLAIEYYILQRYLAPLVDIGKITDKAFNRIEQNYTWYLGAAQTSMKLQGIDHLQSTMNSINRIIINTQLHKDSFKNMGAPEKLKRHS